MPLRLQAAVAVCSVQYLTQSVRGSVLAADRDLYHDSNAVTLSTNRQIISPVGKLCERGKR